MSIPRIFSAWYFKHTPKRKMKESSCNLGLASLLKAGSVPTSYPLLHCLFLFSFLSHSIVGSHSRKGCMCMCSVAQSCLTLCNPTGYSPPGSSVHGIFQAKILEWLPLPTPGHLSNPGIEPVFLSSPGLAGRLFTTTATQEAP